MKEIVNKEKQKEIINQVVDFLNCDEPTTPILEYLEDEFKEINKNYMDIGLKDINGKSIYADCSIVEFEHKYTQRCKKENGIYTLQDFSKQQTETLQGYFTWNSDDLRYEINILNHNFFICLYFIQSMKQFKIIDTIRENKLGLIKEG